MLQFISDIHLEFYKTKINIKKFLTPCAPNLAILGDLGYPHSEHFADFLQQASINYQKVFFVAGNHEYYANSNKDRPTMKEIDIKIKEVCNNYNNIFYLNNDEHMLNDNTIILGTTLWSHIPDNKKRKIKNSMNDYLQIYTNYNIHLTVEDSNHLHEKAVRWLKNKIDQYHDKNVIVLSHHLPSFQLIDKSYEGSEINYAFATDLEYLMKCNVKYWLAGHTHFPAHIKINQCQCLVNPLGYPGENEIKDEQKIMCIE